MSARADDRDAASDAARPYRVSVVMATYNSGAALDLPIASLDAQTMPRDQFQVVVVDDGSTDGTWSRLGEIAATRPNYLIDRIPNSGWPGRPRNLGTAAATGEYVFYLDHDDELFPEALERMYRQAHDNDADLLLGKEVKVGDSTPGWRTWRANVACTTELDANLLMLLTPHKLYRREFLARHRVAFPEGRVRLEDYHFNAQVYVGSPRVSVLADYPCYRWHVHRTNAHNDPVAPAAYWRSFDDSLQPIRDLATPPRTRDLLLRRWYSRLVLDRAERLVGRDNSMRAFMRSEIDRLLEPFPEQLDGGLSHRHRLLSALLRARDFDGMERLVSPERRLSLDVSAVTGGWRRGRFRVAAEGLVRLGSGRPFALRRQGERVVRELPGLDLQVGDDALDLTAEMAAAQVELTVRGRRSAVEWAVPGDGRLSVRDGTLCFEVEADLDPLDCGLGGALPNDIWDVLVRLDAFGYARASRLRSPITHASARRGIRRTVVAQATVGGTLAIGVGKRQAARLARNSES